MNEHAKHHITTATKLVVRVLQDVVSHESFEDYADLAEALKCRCARLRIVYDAGVVSDAIEQLERGGRTPLIVRPDGRRLVERQPEAEIISRAAATTFLAELTARLGRTPTLKRMPAVRRLSAEEVTRRQWTADQAKAHRIVQQAILETAQRVAALEATVEAEP